MDDDDEHRAETVYFDAVAHSALFSAAARQGLTFQEVVNRAVVIYERAITAEPGHVVSLSDPNGGKQRNMVVLPVVLSGWGGLVRVKLNARRKKGRLKPTLTFRGLRRRVRANRENNPRPDPGDSGQQRPDPGA